MREREEILWNVRKLPNKRKLSIIRLFRYFRKFRNLFFLVLHLNDPPDSRAVLAHLRDKFVKEIGCVVRARSGFGMVLDREDRQRFVSHSFQATIIKIEVG